MKTLAQLFRQVTKPRKTTPSTDKDSLVVIGGPNTGTVTWSRTGQGCVGTSDRLPHDASAEEMYKGLVQAEERWREQVEQQ
jgi:hypothetical protein